MIVGDRLKKDVIRADRADGFFLRNVWVEQGAFNDVDVVETNGFRLSRLVRRTARTTACSRSRPTTASTTTSRPTATATPASTRAPVPRATASATASRSATSTPTTTCSATRARRATAPGRTTRRFHDNNAGISDDSFASGHPGMPQDCSKWTDNQVFSNNQNFFTNDRDAYCKNTPFEKRKRKIVCPQFQVPVGSGFILYGVNSNLIENNRDLRQLALRRAAVLGAGLGPRRQRPGPAVRHLQRQPVHRQPDGRRRAAASARPTASTSSGTSRASATAGSATWAPGGRITSDPATLPQCPDGSMFQQSPNPAKFGAEVPCAAWDPRDHAGPARLHLVHHPGQAAAMKWAVAATVVLLAGVGALLLVGDRDGASRPRPATRSCGGRRSRA